LHGVLKSETDKYLAKTDDYDEGNRFGIMAAVLLLGILLPMINDDCTLLAEQLSNRGLKMFLYSAFML